MENSTSSVKGKSLSSSSIDHERTTENTFEESTWTKYFEDFIANDKINDENKDGALSLDYHDERCTSLVSDAASLVVKRSGDDEQAPVGLSTGKSYNRFSFRKKKTKEALFDDDLKDTATSPVNSSKVCDLNKKDNMDISQEKGSAISSRANERSVWVFLGQKVTSQS